MSVLILWHLVVALAAGALGRRLGRKVMLVGGLAPAASVVWLAVSGGAAAAGGVVTEEVPWAPQIGLEIGFRIDGFGYLMAGLVSVIGVLVFLYAWMYFGERPGLGRFAAYLVGFAGSMLGLVLADNLLLLFVFWELTSIASYLLIGYEDETAAARSGALQALLVTGLGGLFMLAGVVLVSQAAGTYSLASILASPPSGMSVGIGLALILVGAFTKSAQFPFHFWLPGAMSAPTPVSAYLHSATMVKAGIYLIARLAPVFASIHEWWRPALITVGLVTMVVGGWRALAQHDLKLLLAQGTVSQLGFIVMLVGVGMPELTFAGVALILAHAVFKASLFMVAGIIDHQVNTRDMRRLTGIGARMPATLATAVVAAASMAGVPPFLGFVSKEAAFEALTHDAPLLVTLVVVLGSALTVAYTLRLVKGSFATKPESELADDPAGWDSAPPAVWFLVPPALLALASIVVGVVPRWIDGVVGNGAAALDAASAEYHLVVWHGWGVPVALSASALLVGWLLWRNPVPALRAVTARAPSATSIYNATIGGLNHVADRVTAIFQSGSLPVYAGVILTTLVAAPGVVLVRHWRPTQALVFAESPLQTVLAVTVVSAAVGTVAVRRRLGAVLLLGAVGYGVAGLFVIQGAPDLALTQLLVETLALALFVLVLSHLPERFDFVGWRLRQVTRVAVSVGVAAFVGVFSLWAASGRTAQPLVDDFMSRAEPQGGGRNVVNVVLTDFRALDTLGEITVLTVAALGVMALIRSRHEAGFEGEGGDS